MNNRGENSARDINIAEIDRLIASLRRGELAVDETVRLEFLLQTSPAAKERYLQSSMVLGALEWESASSRLVTAFLQQIGRDDNDPSFPPSPRDPDAAPSVIGGVLDPQSDATRINLTAESPQLDPPSSTVPFAIPPQSVLRNGNADSATYPPEAAESHVINIVRGAFRFLVRPLPFAAAILVLGAAVGALPLLLKQWASTPAVSVVQNAPPQSLPQEASAASKDTVARLTNSWDAIWTDWATRPKQGALLTPGQRLDLVGGLVEITFDCGAVAILQAPASFIVRAENGGTLEAGRITARVNGPIKKFWVETPTMKVIDWGTEFGVAAEPSGASRVHVFAGKVEVAPASSALPIRTSVPGADRSLFLYAGQGGRVEAHGTFSDKLAAPTAASAFVRTMPDNAIADYIRTILASQPWGYWNFNSLVTATLVPDASGNGRFAQLMEGAMVVQGGTVLAVGPAASLAGSSDWVSIPTGTTLSFAQGFTLEALFRTTGDGAIIAKTPIDSPSGLGGKALYIEGGRLHFEAFHKGQFFASNQVDDGQWHHVMVTNEPSGRKGRDCTIMYVDGVERSRRENWIISEPSDGGMPLKIGIADRSTPSKSFLSGEIDEVAVYDRCVSREEVESHYWAYLKSGMAVHGHQ